jgi:hypothetical protein
VIDAAWPRNQVVATSYTLHGSEGIAVSSPGLDLIEPGLVPAYAGRTIRTTQTAAETWMSPAPLP